MSNLQLSSGRSQCIYWFWGNLLSFLNSSNFSWNQCKVLLYTTPCFEEFYGLTARLQEATPLLLFGTSCSFHLM